jgi:hypothetical protein
MSLYIRFFSDVTTVGRAAGLHPNQAVTKKSSLLAVPDSFGLSWVG